MNDDDLIAVALIALAAYAAHAGSGGAAGPAPARRIAPRSARLGDAARDPDRAPPSLLWRALVLLAILAAACLGYALEFLRAALRPLRRRGR